MFPWCHRQGMTKRCPTFYNDVWGGRFSKVVFQHGLEANCPLANDVRSCAGARFFSHCSLCARRPCQPESSFFQNVIATDTLLHSGTSCRKVAGRVGCALAEKVCTERPKAKQTIQKTRTHISNSKNKFRRRSFRRCGQRD